MIALGIHHTLIASRRMPQGMYLEDKHEEEVLLPNKYIPADLVEGQEVRVFVYKDGMGRIIATTLTPALTIGKIGMLTIETNSTVGAFAEWGLEKHLLIPYDEQMADLKEGRSYLVRLVYDDVSDRLFGSTKISKYLEKEEIHLEIGEEVDIVIWIKTELGYKVIIENLYEGLIYHSDIFQKVRIGDQVKGYIKTVREDLKIDVILQKSGYQHISEYADKIMAALKDQEGFLSLTDKSSPEEIYAELQMSKKNFKKAVGALYKQRIITIEDHGIRLIP